MTREKTLMGRPVRSLQTMLRTLAQQEGLRISVIPDGIYGQNTMSAVLRFQQINGLPATGVADLQTWNAIAAQYRAIVSADSCFFHTSELAALARRWGGPEDESLQWLQQLAGLPESETFGHREQAAANALRGFGAPSDSLDPAERII